MVATIVQEPSNWFGTCTFFVRGICWVESHAIGKGREDQDGDTSTDCSGDCAAEVGYAIAERKRPAR